MRTLLSTLIFITCLLLGYQSGVTLGSQNRFTSGRLVSSSSTNPDRPSTPAATLPNGQRSILWIGIDDLQSSSPRLESIWIVSYVANSTRLTFLPLFPALADNSTGKRVDLSSRFRLHRSSGRAQLGADFLEDLRQHAPWWGSIVLVDRAALGELVSAGMGSGSRAGSMDLAELPYTWEDPGSAVMAQANLLQEMCWNATRSDGSLDVAGLVEQLSGHILSDLDPAALVEELEDVRAQMSRYSCEFPTLAAPGNGMDDY
jgi:hypothetical protein